MQVYRQKWGGNCHRQLLRLLAVPHTGPIHSPPAAVRAAIVAGAEGEMRALTIAAMAVLALWMGYLTWRVEHLNKVADATCAYAYAAEKRMRAEHEIIFFCPTAK
jgi:hypothetical protein